MDGAGNSVFGEEAFEGTGTLREREVRPRITALICGRILPAEKDLRALQKQLGHSSVQTTQIYADVTVQDIQKQIRGLWG